MHRCSAILLVGSLLTRVASADGAAEVGPDLLGERLTWDVPPDSGCPTRSWAEARIRAAVSSGPEALEFSELAARVAIVRDEAGYQVEIETTSGDGEGHRHVAGSTCVEVAEAATVIVALAIDARVLAEESQPVPKPVEAPPREQPEEKASAAEPRDTSHRYFVRALGTFDTGTLPRATAGVQAQLGARIGRLALAVRALYLPPVSAEVASVSAVDAGGRFSALETTAAVCWNEAWSEHFWSDLCGGVGIGILFAEGFGAEALTASVDPAAAVPFDAAFGLKLTRAMSLWVGAGGRVLAPRRAYAIENLGPIYTPEPIAVRAGAGLEIGW